MDCALSIKKHVRVTNLFYFLEIFATCLRDQGWGLDVGFASTIMHDEQNHGLSSLNIPLEQTPTKSQGNFLIQIQ
jgi:hypothetical protein